MREFKKRFLQLLGIVMFVTFLPGMYWLTMNAGDGEIGELAVKYKICSKASECTEENKNEIVSAVLSNSEFESYSQVQWCLGVRDMTEGGSRRNALMKSLMAKFGYLFCPDFEE